MDDIDMSVRSHCDDGGGDSSSEYDTELEDNEETLAETKARQQQIENELNYGVGSRTYEIICDKLKLVPIRKLLDQLSSSSMILQHIGMNTGQCKALACALWHNTCLETLELKDNGLTGNDIELIIKVIKYNGIHKLGFPDNCLEEVGAMAVDEMIRVSSCLTHLNLSGCKLGDCEVEYIASGLHYNMSLIWLDLSNNNISSEGGKNLGRCLEETHTLQSLNLNWNHIRMSGAVGLLKGLQGNDSLSSLDLAMNGLGFEGCLALESMLKENTCLKYLDISHDRINWEGVSFVAKGLRKNNTLEVLKMGNNPINMEGCYDVLKAVTHPKSQVKHIGFDNIPVNGAVLTVTSDILKHRPFSITHGGILETRDVVGIRKEKPEDPITLVVRYLATMGIRMIDMYRMLDADNDGHVTKKEFVIGMKKLGIPLADRALKDVATRLDRKRTGIISYSILAAGVKNHVREERKEDTRQKVKKRTKLEERRRILETELPIIYKRSYADDLMQFQSAQSLTNINYVANSSNSNDRATNQKSMFPDIESSNSLVPQNGEKCSDTDSSDCDTSRSNVSSGHTHQAVRRRFRRPLEMLKVINAFIDKRNSIMSTLDASPHPKHVHNISSR